MNSKLLGLCAVLLMTTPSCKTNSPAAPGGRSTFGDDVAFLEQHVETIVISDPKGAAQVAIVPAWQGRVMTSSASGDGGASFGWVNRELIASNKKVEHINPYGGEDRFWIGPEGGQYSIFFAPGAAFDLDHWFTPAALDTEPFQVVEREQDRAVFKKRMQLTNYAATKFEVEVTREVRMRDPQQVLAAMRVELPQGVDAVAFESVNTLANVGSKAWTKETGLLSIWILGMFNATERSTVVIPFQTGPDGARGPVVNDEYFGKVPADRLRVDNDKGYLCFKADGKYRSKIGVGPKRVGQVLGSYDAEHKVLTLVEFTMPKGPNEYVNSLWKIQAAPYGGDVVNSYNDGPSKPGAKQLGAFYELESSSPALALRPGERATHVHRTTHLHGSELALDVIARKALGVPLVNVTEPVKP